MIGWASGGLVFGVLGDRIGRAKTMLLTILIYSLFTGLSALSVGVWDFALLPLPDRPGRRRRVRRRRVAGGRGDARPGAAVCAGAAAGALGRGQHQRGADRHRAGQLEGAGGFEGWHIVDQPVHAWRVMFVIGTVPALLAILIRRRLKEPERWKAAADDEGHDSRKLGSYRRAVRRPALAAQRDRRHVLAFSGVVGLWGIGFFSFDLIRSVFTQALRGRRAWPPAEIAGKLTFWIGITSLLQNVGGFFGIYAFSRVTHAHRPQAGLRHLVRAGHAQHGLGLLVS